MRIGGKDSVRWFDLFASTFFFGPAGLGPEKQNGVNKDALLPPPIVC